jgi:hypothetical protein
MTASCRCGARWSGLRMEHCTVCHQTFPGSSLGDAHRVGRPDTPQRRCLTPDEMRDKGWALTQRGNSTPVWHMPSPQTPRFPPHGNVTEAPHSPEVAHLSTSTPKAVTDAPATEGAA